MDEQTPTLTHLVARAAAGDQRAWDEIVARFSGLLWGVARSYRLEPHAAADAVQGTWLALIQSLDRIADPEALPGWLLTTVRREALRMLRASGRELLDSLDEPPERAQAESAELDLALLTEERDSVLWRCFRGLSEKCQRLLRILMSPEAPPYAVVAAELGVPIGSLGPTRMRCLTALRQQLVSSGYDFGATAGGGSR